MSVAVLHMFCFLDFQLEMTTMGDNYVPPRIVVGQHWHCFYHHHETSPSLLLLLLLLLLPSLYHYMKNVRNLIGLEHAQLYFSLI